MMQTDNALMTTADGNRVFIPCSCGDDGDNISFIHFPSDSPEEDPIYMGVSVRPGSSLKYRIGRAWRALQGNVHTDEVGISRATAKALAEWLGGKV